jgi:putative ABC transport system permease protein
MSNTWLILRLSLESMLGNKVRSFLTMLGIIIGIASVIAIMSLGAGAQSLITSSLKNLGTSTITILPGNSEDDGPPAIAMGIVVKTLTEEDADALAKLPNVTGVLAYKEGSADITAGRRYTNANYAGVSANYPEVQDHALSQGRFFSEQEARAGKKVVVLGDEVRELLFPLSNAIGQTIKVQGQQFQVVGVLERKGSALFVSPDKQVYLPLKVAQHELAGESYLTSIRLKASSESVVELTKTRAQELLRIRHKITNDQDDFSVRTVNQALSVFNGVIGALKFFLAAIAGVSLVVGGISITNIMLMSVKERTKEIGLKKALGAKRSHIEQQFILESITLTLVGGIFGVALGTAFSFFVAIVMSLLDYKWAFVISPIAVLVAVGTSATIGLVFGVYPAKKAAELNPIDALRYE